MYLTRESAEPGTSFLIVGAHDVASLVEGTDGNANVEDDDSVHRMHHRLKEALGRNFWAAMTGGGKQRPLLEASVRTFRNGVEIIPESRVDPRETQPSRTRALQAFLDGTTVDRMTESGSGQVAMATVPLMVPGRAGRGNGGEHRAVVLVTEADDREGKPNRVTTMRGNRMTVKVGWVPGLPVGTNPFQAVLLAGRAAGDDARIMALGDGFPDGELPSHVEGVPVHLFQARHVLPMFEVSGITSAALLRTARRMMRGADLVHVHLMRDLVTLPAALLALATRTPLVVQTHGMIDPTEKRVAQLTDLLGVRKVLREADAVLH
nr:hypothetical protein [Streptomyces sp. DSM 41633]